MARGKFTGGKHWVKGQSGNPNGRPKKGKSMTELLEAYGKTKDGELTKRQKLIQKLYELAFDGNIYAIKYIMDRIDGKPHESIRIEGGDSPLEFVDWSKLTPSEAKKLFFNMINEKKGK